MPMSIVNDTIITHEGSFDLTPREDNVRDAMLIMRIAAPIIASVIIWVLSPKGWSYASAWTFNRLAIIWFWSVGIVGLWVHFQEGKTTRATLTLAVLHTQVEVLINSLFLGLSLGKASALAGIWGLILYPPMLVVPSIKIAWFLAATMGGAGDLLVLMLLTYGKKWWYAAGALAHVLSAVLVFAETVMSVDLIIYNGISFTLLWLHFGFITLAVLKDAHNYHQPGYIRLSSAIPMTVEQLEQGSSGPGPKDPAIPWQKVSNPLDHVHVPLWVFVVMVVAGLGGAFGTAFVLDYLAGRI